MKNKNILIKGTFLVAVFLLLGGLFLFGQALDMSRKSKPVRTIPKVSKAIAVPLRRDACLHAEKPGKVIRSASGANDLLIHKSITVFIP